MLNNVISYYRILVDNDLVRILVDISLANVLIDISSAKDISRW